MARNSNDLKEATVKLRVNETMRKQIEKVSRKKGVTISEYIRELIKKDLLLSK